MSRTIRIIGHLEAAVLEMIFPNMNPNPVIDFRLRIR